MFVLAFSTVRSGHDLLNFPIVYIILGLDVLGLLCIRHTGDLDYGMDLLPFIAALALGILVQNETAGGYYNVSDSFSAFVLLFAMVVCVIMLTQRGYTHYIWKAINITNLLSASCIIVMTLSKLAGIRLDQLGILSDFFFNAWEFVSAYRPCGPFLEPAMYAQLGLLSLFYYLFLKRNWWKACLTALALFLSTSSLGLLGTVLLIAIFLLFLDKLCGVSKRAKYLTLVATLVCGFLLFLLLMYLDSYSLERALSGSSLGVRFLRSVDLFQLMTPLQKIFGIGLQNQLRYLNYYSIILAHDTYETTIGANREFASVLGYIPCATGLIGFITFLFPFFRAFFRGGIRTKTAVLLFMYTCLFCCILTHSIFLIYIMAVYATLDFDRQSAKNF